MTALIAADRCPSCRRVHGDPGDWPRCPEHGHWLHEHKATAGRVTYACPGWKCKHTHTQKERATMTTANEHAASALAIRADQELFNAKQLAALAQLGIKDASNADLAVFMHYCQKTGLDPFSRQIYMIARKGRDGVVKQTIQVGIDGYRVIAQRAARRDNVSLGYGNTTWYNANGEPHAVWTSPEPPAAAAVIVYRDGKPFPGTARFASFAAVTRDGQLMGQWATMPDHMIAKCAEAQALRKAFPHDLVGLSTDDETAHLGNHRQKVDVNPYAALPEPVRRHAREGRPPPQDPETVKNAIRAHFDRLHIDDDTDERDMISIRLVGADNTGQITPGQFELILSVLESCDDRAQLDEILDPIPPEAS